MLLMAGLRWDSHCPAEGQGIKATSGVDYRSCSQIGGFGSVRTMTRETKKRRGWTSSGVQQGQWEVPNVNKTHVCRSRAEVETVKLGVDELSGNVTGWGDQEE